MSDEQSQNFADSTHLQSSSALLSPIHHGAFGPSDVSSRVEPLDVPLTHLEMSRPTSSAVLHSQAICPQGIDNMERPEAMVQTVQPHFDSPFFGPPPLPPGLHIPPPPPFTNEAIPGRVSMTQRPAFVDKLDNRQEELRDSRDEVLGSRFRLQAKRKELRDLRIETGAKDGSVFNMLRQYLHEVHTDLPQEIKEALEDASCLRDSLGLLETEYDEAEVSYNALEWNYTRKESGFVEELLNNNFVPNRTPNQSSQYLENVGLTRFAGASSDGIDPNDIEQLPMESQNHNLILSGPAHSQSQKAASLRSNNSVARSIRQFGENGLSDAQSDWVKKMERIDVWLMDMISSSPLQKAHLRAMDHFDYPDNDFWWERVKLHWAADNEEMPVFHTGDSTVSQHVASQHISTSTVDIMGSRSPAIEVGLPTPSLGRYYVLDATETPSISASIKSRDLSETSSQDQAFPQPPSNTIDEIIGSVSMPSRRISNDTDTTSHHSCYCDKCINRSVQPILDREVVFRCPTFNENIEWDGQSALATPTQHTPGSPSDVANSLSSGNVQIATATLDGILSETKTTRDTSFGSTALPVCLNKDGTDDLDPTQVPLPPTPNSERLPVSEVQPLS